MALVGFLVLVGDVWGPFYTVDWLQSKIYTHHGAHLHHSNKMARIKYPDQLSRCQLEANFHTEGDAHDKQHHPSADTTVNCWTVYNGHFPTTLIVHVKPRPRVADGKDSNSGVEHCLDKLLRRWNELEALEASIAGQLWIDTGVGPWQPVVPHRHGRRWHHVHRITGSFICYTSGHRRTHLQISASIMLMSMTTLNLFSIFIAHEYTNI